MTGKILFVIFFGGLVFSGTNGVPEPGNGRRNSNNYQSGAGGGGGSGLVTASLLLSAVGGGGGGFNRPGHGNQNFGGGGVFNRPAHGNQNFGGGGVFNRPVPGNQNFGGIGAQGGHYHHGGNTGSNSCKLFCSSKLAGGDFVCCDEDSSKPGKCPLLRPCPPTGGVRNHFKPVQCGIDAECAYSDKCCFDDCLDHRACKPVLW